MLIHSLYYTLYIVIILTGCIQIVSSSFIATVIIKNVKQIPKYTSSGQAYTKIQILRIRNISVFFIKNIFKQCKFIRQYVKLCVKKRISASLAKVNWYSNSVP